jgi:hypothetical protein
MGTGSVGLLRVVNGTCAGSGHRGVDAMQSRGDMYALASLSTAEYIDDDDIPGGARGRRLPGSWREADNEAAGTSYEGGIFAVEISVSSTGSRTARNIFGLTY